MKKQLIAAALMTAMLTALVSCGKNSEAANVEYIYGKIDSISGNDVVLLLAEEKSDKSDGNAEAETETSEKQSSGKRSGKSKGERSEGFSKPENGEIPSDFNFKDFSGEKTEGSGKPENGEMPSDFNFKDFSGEKTEGSGKPENGEMPSDFNFKDFSGEKPERSGKPENERTPKLSSNSGYTLTGEQEELRIPVGTDVTTIQGVKTDFDALEEGLIIKCSVEKDSDGNDVVTEVWVVE